MVRRLYRTQILLEPEQHKALTEMARREGRSMSEVVREMVQRELEQVKQTQDADLQRQLEALEIVRRHRQAILDARGGKPIDFDVIAAIEEGRKERDERVFNSAINPGD